MPHDTLSRLEHSEGKLSCCVLRGESGRKVADLPDKWQRVKKEVVMSSLRRCGTLGAKTEPKSSFGAVTGNWLSPLFLSLQEKASRKASLWGSG